MIDKESQGDDDMEKELHEHYRFEVDPAQSPIRLDKYLLNKLEKASRSRIQKAIKDKAILVNGQEIKSNYKVRPLDTIVIVLPEEPKEKEWAVGEDIPLDIRYEDEHLMVVYKPPGLVVHPGVGNRSGTLVNGLVHYFSKIENLPTLPGNDRTRSGLVHRIDKETSGLLVVAKTESAMTHLAKQFFDHTIDREYVAIIWGSLDPSSGTIEGNIGRHPKERKKMFVYVDGEDGKEAVTHYETIEDLYYVSLIKCKLETGRTHQIRVHMASNNHPLFNDQRYGGDKIVKGTVFTKYKQFVHNAFKLMTRHALHAQSLGFVHPETKEYMKFETPLPEDMQATIDKWRHYVTHQKSKQ
jgi:23S rRNA pseudouridine1911/1915/1917 synthase